VSALRLTARKKAVTESELLRSTGLSALSRSCHKASEKTDTLGFSNECLCSE